MKYAIPGLAILLFFSSCTDNSKSELVVFEATTKSLEQSSKAISNITTDYRKQLFERLNDPRTTVQAEIWQPRAVKISELASSIIGYVNTLKSQLVGKYDDFQVVNKVFFQQEKGKELHQRLKNFIDSIFKVDTGLNNQYAQLIGDKFNYLDSANYNDKEFTEIFFNQVSIAAAFSLLAKFENDIRNTEKEIVTYCYNQTFPMHSCIYEPFQILMKLSSSCVKAGDEIELDAGVGSFSIPAQLNFTVDGEFIPANENGIVTYKFKTPLKAGKYNKAVKMEFTEPDGAKKTMTKNIEYTVIEPK